MMSGMLAEGDQWAARAGRKALARRPGHSVEVAEAVVWHYIHLDNLVHLLATASQSLRGGRIAPMAGAGCPGASTGASCGLWSCCERCSIWLKLMFMFGWAPAGPPCG